MPLFHRIPPTGCPPGYVRHGKLCVPRRPAAPIRHLIFPVTVGIRGPFGTVPSGGLFPFSNAADTAAPAKKPSPPPPAPCVTATIFGDCFSGCNGTIDMADPGPVCGWSYDHPFVSSAGSITFTPGAMTLNADAVNDSPGASKPLPASLASIFNITGRFLFSEYSPPGIGAGSYLFLITNIDNSESFGLLMDQSSILHIQAGAGAGPDFPTFEGTWTPTGGEHQIDFTVDALGNITLFIDGSQIALVSVPFFTPFADTLPGNRFYVSGQTFTTDPSTATITRFFVASGNLPIDTVYCCP